MNKALVVILCAAVCGAVRADPLPAAESAYAPLQLQAGTWAAAVQYYEDDKAAGTATGVEVDTLVVNGHWIANDFEIAATEKAPAYRQHGMWGYDLLAKTYVAMWVDTVDQTVRTDYGSWSEAEKTMVWSSKQNDGNGHYTDYRMVEEFKGDERVFTVYRLGLVKPNPHPVLKIVFTKKQPEIEHAAEPPPKKRQYQRPG